MGRSTTLKQLYLIVMAIVGWFAVVLQIALVVGTAVGKGQSSIHAVVNTLSYFTVLTNLLIAILVTASAWGGKSDTFLTRPGIMSAAAVYIFTVGLVYSLLLRSLWDPKGLQLVADIALHNAMPILYVLFWLFFVPKRKLRWMQPVYWLSYPLAYIVYTMVRGILTGKYPYPFADVTTLGYPRALANAAIMLAGFLILGLIAVAIGRSGRRSDEAASTPR